MGLRGHVYKGWSDRPTLLATDTSDILTSVQLFSITAYAVHVHWSSSKTSSHLLLVPQSWYMPATSAAHYKSRQMGLMHVVQADSQVTDVTEHHIQGLEN